MAQGLYVYMYDLWLKARWRAKRGLSGEVNGNFVLPHIPVCVYLFIYMCCTFMTRECAEDFTDST